MIGRFGTEMELVDMNWERDIKLTVDGFNPLPSAESRGLRVVIRGKE